MRTELAEKPAGGPARQSGAGPRDRRGEGGARDRTQGGTTSPDSQWKVEIDGSTKCGSPTWSRSKSKEVVANERAMAGSFRSQRDVVAGFEALRGVEAPEEVEERRKVTYGGLLAEGSGPAEDTSRARLPEAGRRTQRGAAPGPHDRGERTDRGRSEELAPEPLRFPAARVADGGGDRFVFEFIERGFGKLRLLEIDAAKSDPAHRW